MTLPADVARCIGTDLPECTTCRRRTDPPHGMWADESFGGDMSTLREAAQQALEAMLNFPDDISDEMFASIAALKAVLAQPAPETVAVQEQDIEDAIEAAYWHFDARKKGLNEWASAPQSERDAFKAETRKLVKGYFPTRQAQDTKREMLAVADAFIRGKRAALAQEQAEPTGKQSLQVESVQEPVAWSGYDLDGMVEAFSRVIEAHHSSKHPFHNPIDMDAKMALRILRGCIPAMKAYAAPPQRKPLTSDKDRPDQGTTYVEGYGYVDTRAVRAVERAHGIGGQP